MAVLLAPKMSKKVSKKVLPWFWMRTLSLSLSNECRKCKGCSSSRKQEYVLIYALNTNVILTSSLTRRRCGNWTTGGKNERHLSCRVTHILAAVTRTEQERTLSPPPPTMLKYSDSAVKQTLEKPGSQIFRSTSCLWKHSTQINQQHLTDVPSIVTHSAGGTGEVKWWNREWIAEKKEEEEGWW